MSSLATEKEDFKEDDGVIVPHIVIKYPRSMTNGTIIDYQLKVPKEENNLTEDDLNEENCNFLLAELCRENAMKKKVSEQHISGFLIINNKHFFGYGRKKRVRGNNPLHVETTIMLTLLKIVKNKNIENINSLRLYSTLQPCCMCSLVIHQVVAKIKQMQRVKRIDCQVYYGVEDSSMIVFDSTMPNLGDQSETTKFDKESQQHKASIWNHNCVPHDYTRPGPKKQQKKQIYTSNQLFDQMLEENDKILTYVIESPEKEKASNKAWGFYNTLKDLFSTKVLIRNQASSPSVVGEGAEKFKIESPTLAESATAKKGVAKVLDREYGYDKSLDNEVIFQYLDPNKYAPEKRILGKLFNFINEMNKMTEIDKSNIFWMFLPGILNCDKKAEKKISIRNQKDEQNDGPLSLRRNISNYIPRYCNLKAFSWNESEVIACESCNPPTKRTPKGEEMEDHNPAEGSDTNENSSEWKHDAPEWTPSVEDPRENSSEWNLEAAEWTPRGFGSYHGGKKTKKRKPKRGKRKRRITMKKRKKRKTLKKRKKRINRKKSKVNRK